MRKQLINPPQLYDGKPHGLSHAVVDTASSVVYVSGQVDWDANHQVSSHTVEGQLRNVLTNLTIVLDAAGSSVENLLHLRIYVRGELGESMEAIAPLRTFGSLLVDRVQPVTYNVLIHGLDALAPKGRHFPR